jgi:hypothetical protein
MPYYKFNSNDVYINTLKTNPSLKFVVYSGSSFYNNAPNISGAFADPIRLTDSGHISLYELNIDRQSTNTGRTLGPSTLPDQTINDNGLIYSWVVKNSSRIGFRTTSKAAFSSNNFGDVMSSSYPYTSSISKEYYSTTTPRSGSSNVSYLFALKNTINYYRYKNPNFTYGAFGPITRSLDSIEVGLISLPSIFYGSTIQKGTIDLGYYITGTLCARAKDFNQDGLLYETYNTNGTETGSLIGFALYDEGFIVLTASYNLSDIVDHYTTAVTGDPATENPKWVYFAQSISGAVTAPSSSFIMSMSGTNKIQTMTMFATAPKGELNQSSNPTFVTYTTGSTAATGSKQYVQASKRLVKNIVSSSYHNPTGSFEKTTYISKIGIYDKDRNLIGIAKMATPVRKTVERDFTFKIKLDL